MAPSPEIDVGRTVLIVEDEKAVSAMLARVVESTGAHALVARNGAEARRLLAAGPVDCALIDKNLPDETGLDVLRAVRAAHPDTVAAIVTGYGNVETATEALLLGAVDYVCKPFRVNELSEGLKTLFEERRRPAKAIVRRRSVTLGWQCRDQSVDLTEEIRAALAVEPPGRAELDLRALPPCRVEGLTLRFALREVLSVLHDDARFAKAPPLVSTRQWPSGRLMVEVEREGCHVTPERVAELESFLREVDPQDRRAQDPGKEFLRADSGELYVETWSTGARFRLLLPGLTS